MNEITIQNKRNLNTKRRRLQNDQNADTTLLHSHDDMWFHKDDWEGEGCNAKLRTAVKQIKLAGPARSAGSR